jgi:hypothetical protein
MSAPSNFVGVRRHNSRIVALKMIILAMKLYFQHPRFLGSLFPPLERQ